jgi:hypothetical protein
MAGFNFNDIRDGINSGIQRAETDITEPKPIDTETLQQNLEVVLDSFSEDLSPHFVRYFSEMSAIAAVSRLTFGYPDLDITGISEYLDVSVSFFDSFTHRKS